MQGNTTSVKTTSKDTQMYKNIYHTFYAQIALECGLRPTPPKSHSVQSAHKMWPYIHLGIAICICQCIEIT